MPRLINQLEIEKCPHCRVDKPNLQGVAKFETKSHDGTDKRFWQVYVCKRCGGTITAYSGIENGDVIQMYPKSAGVDESIPEKARRYLEQALNSLHSPDGSVMLSASAIDAMLKAKGYKDGSLYSRIDKAKDDHLITEEMAFWAHEVRLDANDPRHADEETPFRSEKDARKCIDFTLALGQFLFVLPAMVNRGLKDAQGE